MIEHYENKFFGLELQMRVKSFFQRQKKTEDFAGAAELNLIKYKNKLHRTFCNP